MSGRKGLGVKADDLISAWNRMRLAEVKARHGDLPEKAQRETRPCDRCRAALRYFLLKFTRNSVIAFDFKEALSFEGETGPLLPVRGGAGEFDLPKARMNKESVHGAAATG